MHPELIDVSRMKYSTLTLHFTISESSIPMYKQIIKINKINDVHFLFNFFSCIFCREFDINSNVQSNISIPSDVRQANENCSSWKISIAYHTEVSGNANAYFHITCAMCMRPNAPYRPFNVAKKILIAFLVVQYLFGTCPYCDQNASKNYENCISYSL